MGIVGTVPSTVALWSMIRISDVALSLKDLLFFSFEPTFLVSRDDLLSFIYMRIVKCLKPNEIQEYGKKHLISK